MTDEQVKNKLYYRVEELMGKKLQTSQIPMLDNWIKPLGRDLLERVCWDFACRIEVLKQVDITVPEMFVYEEPINVARIFFIFNDTLKEATYSKFYANNLKKVLMTNIPNCNILYTPTDVAMHNYSAEFIEVLSLYMAHDLYAVFGPDSFREKTITRIKLKKSICDAEKNQILYNNLKNRFNNK